MCAAGQSASFALKRVKRKEVRKGMVVLPKLDTPPKVYREFVAEGKPALFPAFLPLLFPTIHHPSTLPLLHIPCNYTGLAEYILDAH